MTLSPARAAELGRKSGSVRRARSTDPDERFWSKVDRNGRGGCWLWTASLNRYGYPNFGAVNGRPMAGHRYAYERLVGPIPAGLQLDHLCRVRRCVNPAHLEPVTPKENTRRGLRARMTHPLCPICSVLHAADREAMLA